VWKGYTLKIGKNSVATMSECNFCHGNHLKTGIEFNGFTIYTCNSCGLSKVYPTPDTAKIYADFSDNVAQGNSKSYISYFKSKPDHFKYFIYDHRIKPIEKYDPIIFSDKKSCVVDVGCGSGTFLAYMKSIGFENLWGLDYNQKNVEEIKSAFHINALHGDIGRLRDIPPGDLMVLYDVLEHVPDPQLYLKAIYNHLNTAGVVQIRVPNYGSLWARVLKKRWLWTIPPFHLNYFNVRVLRSMLVEAGFSDIKIFSNKSGFRMVFYFLQISKAFKNRVNVEGLSRSLTDFLFYSFLVLEKIFSFLYYPIAFVLQRFDADDCIEVYARKK